MIAHLGPGGAQRVAATAANELAERGYDVHVIITMMHPREQAYELDPRVVLHLCSRMQADTPDEELETNPANASPRAASSAAATQTAPATAKPNTVSEARPSLRKRIAQFGPVATYVKPVVVPVVVFVSHNVRRIPRSLRRVLRSLLGFVYFPLRSLLGFVYFPLSMSMLRRVKHLRRKIKETEPDAVLSFLTQTNILTVLATRGLRTHTVISERNDPRLQRHRPRVELLRRLVYRHADVITANSRGALTALEPFVPKKKLAFLPNPLALSLTDDVAEFTAPTAITVGRLVEQKGLDVLLVAWANAARALPGWRLAMVGDGPLCDELQALACNLGIGDRVDWHGHISDPIPLLRASQFFVMTSRFEGTPNALLEAMACGLPAIVSDASPGPCELVGEKEDAGLIVPVESVDRTAEAIVRMAKDEPLRQRLSAAARERVREFETDQALDVWLKLLRCE